MKKISLLALALSLLTLSCNEGKKSKYYETSEIPYSDETISNSTGNEEYPSLVENNFELAANNPLSTFSIDVDTDSYSNIRRMINQGQIPPKEAVRTEEMINYFKYDYPEPYGNNPVSITTEMGNSPWNPSYKLVKIGLKAKEKQQEELPPSNLVFLIDTSGSMEGADRIELVKSSLKLLVNQLGRRDRIAIVTYAGTADIALNSMSGNEKGEIISAIEELTANGSTAGGEGLELAYKVAKENFISSGNNRIILCTDGDFNVGPSSEGELEHLIEEKRNSGIYLSVLGYGMGNYKDNKMQILAQKGNGNHAYIDNMQEANKVLVNEFSSTLFTVAKDVKIQVEFNPEKVQYYRLIGYETRLLNKEDFNDDTKDAGEMGAGHTVTVIYEIIPVGIKANNVANVDALKYQRTRNTDRNEEILEYSDSPDWLTIKMRYKDPKSETSEKIETTVQDNQYSRPSEDFIFASAVVMYSQLLQNSKYSGDSDYDKVIQLAKSSLGNDEQGYRKEFIRLVKVTKGLSKN